MKLGKQTRILKQQGFSMIEIMVVLVIIGILAALIAPNVIDRVDDARLQKVHADFKAIETALKLYKLDNFTYPTTEQSLEALVNKPDIDPEPRNWRSGGYLENEPVDPWGQPYIYVSPGDHGDFDLISLGADQVSGGEGNNADIGNWDAGKE